MSKKKKRSQKEINMNNVFIGVIVGVVLISLALTAFFAKITKASYNTNWSTFSGTVGEYTGGQPNPMLGDFDNRVVVVNNAAYTACFEQTGGPSAGCEGAKQTFKVNGKTKDGSNLTRHFEVNWVPLEVCGTTEMPTDDMFCALPYWQVTVLKGTYIE